MVGRCPFAFIRSFPSYLLPRTFYPYAQYDMRPYWSRVVPQWNAGPLRETQHDERNIAEARKGLRIPRIRHHSIGNYSARRHSLGLFEGPQWTMMPSGGWLGGPISSMASKRPADGIDYPQETST